MMFKKLIPWKRRNSNIAVRRDEPTRQIAEGDYYPLARLWDEFDSLFQRLFEDRWLSERTGGLPSLWGEPRLAWSWDLGWEDRGNDYVYQAELPGFEPEDFDVKVSGNLLTVSAEHREEKKRKHTASYRYGSFTRTLTLPHGADPDKVEARYHSGVLEIHLPKSEAAATKRIEVKTG